MTWILLMVSSISELSCIFPPLADFPAPPFPEEDDIAGLPDIFMSARFCRNGGLFQDILDFYTS